MINKIVTITLFILISILFPVNSFSTVVYEIQPEGHSLSSLDGALEDIKNRLEDGNFEDVVVFLDDGIYYLDRPLLFNIGCANNVTISFFAKEGTKPVISGGKLLQEWTIEESNPRIVKTTSDTDISNLWIGRERLRKSSGFTGYASGIFEGIHDGNLIQGLLFPKADFPSFQDISGLEIKHYHQWRSYSFKVEAIFDNNIIPEIPEDQLLVCIRNFDVALSQTPAGNWIGIGPKRPYYFENSTALLDQPGEYCYIPSIHTIYYYLRDNETADNINVIAPRLENILSVKSTENPVTNLFFKGIEFSHCNWEYPVHNGFITHQSSVHYTGIGKRSIIPSAISLEDARNIRFESCRFSKLSSNGVGIRNNTDEITLENCEFEDISGSAISISDYNHKAYRDSILPVKNTMITNNLIESIGLDFPSCAAIEAFYTEDLTISHNELYDCPYTAISVGWGWTMAPNTQKNVKIMNNLIVGDTQKCVDGGAIYSLSSFADEGLLIQGNYIDETEKNHDSNQGAIYADEGSSNVRINNNVILTDRRWFFYHQAGKIEVDTTYVLLENRDKYGGINAPTGGTQINYVENGNHIFCLPNELADSIRNNAGRISKEDIPDWIEDTYPYQDLNFDTAISFGRIKIIPLNNIPGIIFDVKIWGVDGSLYYHTSTNFDDELTIPITRGFYIVEIASQIGKKSFKVVR